MFYIYILMMLLSATTLSPLHNWNGDNFYWIYTLLITFFLLFTLCFRFAGCWRMRLCPLCVILGSSVRPRCRKWLSMFWAPAVDSTVTVKTSHCSLFLGRISHWRNSKRQGFSHMLTPATNFSVLTGRIFIQLPSTWYASSSKLNNSTAKNIDLNFIQQAFVKHCIAEHCMGHTQP